MPFIQSQKRIRTLNPPIRATQTAPLVPVGWAALHSKKDSCTAAFPSVGTSQAARSRHGPSGAPGTQLLPPAEQSVPEGRTFQVQQYRAPSIRQVAPPVFSQPAWHQTRTPESQLLSQAILLGSEPMPSTNGGEQNDGNTGMRVAPAVASCILHQILAHDVGPSIPEMQCSS